MLLQPVTLNIREKFYKIYSYLAPTPALIAREHFFYIYSLILVILNKI